MQRLNLSVVQQRLPTPEYGKVPHENKQQSEDKQVV